jgi:hypothetical protein
MRPAMRGEPAARFQPPGWLARATSATGPQVTYAGRLLTRRPLLTAATVREAYLQSCVLKRWDIVVGGRGGLSERLTSPSTVRLELRKR